MSGESIAMFTLKDKTAPTFPAHKDQSAKNRTGIPDHLKEGFEHLSGYSMDDIKIHYNSAKPAQLQALAYTQSNNVYLGAGQEKHLGHELWHVVQQKQGRVMPTTQINGFPVNDNTALEHEADLYGKKAAQFKTENPRKVLSNSPAPYNNTLQRFTENDVSYATVGEYYGFLSSAPEGIENARQKEALDKLINIFSEHLILNVNISTCNSWRDVGTAIKDNLSQNQEESQLSLFLNYKNNFEPYMDLTKQYFQSLVFGEDHSLIQKLVQNFDLFKLLYEHEMLDRVPLEAPIDPNDIEEEYNPSKACVIVALFQAEHERIRGEFHAENVEQFHEVLVTAFKHNKYTDQPTGGEVTEHQQNNVWKNYSDDAVYPSLYAHFGYKSHNDCYQMNLGTAIRQGNLPEKKGMIRLPGHMIYFDNTHNPPTFYDNDSGEHAPSQANKNERINCIYYKD